MFITCAILIYVVRIAPPLATLECMHAHVCFCVRIIVHGHVSLLVSLSAVRISLMHKYS